MTTGTNTINPAISDLRWNRDGLVPAIAQDASTGMVLMMAWMNREALRLTLEEGIAVYWSRSRQKIWRKGESSGHRQIIRELRIDCDDDCILIRVEQVGGIACHTGRASCFYRRFNDGDWQVTDDPVLEPEDIYGQ